MKKSVSGLLVILALLLMATTASALTINSGSIEVGVEDLLVGSADLGNSGDATELAWVQSIIGTDYSWNVKYGSSEADWVLTNQANTFAMQFDGPIFPEYYMVKTGTGAKDPALDHFLFDNRDSMLEWAVLNLKASFGDNVEIKNIGKFSHLVEFGGGAPVPEPGTLLLLGSGLLGLVVMKRKSLKR